MVIYVAEAMAKSGGDWGIVGVSLQSPGTRPLKPQGWAYTALELAPEGEKPQLVTVLRDVLAAPESPQAVLTSWPRRRSGSSA